MCVFVEVQSVKYRGRKAATAYARERGIPLGASTLAQLATTGEGPLFRYFGRRYVIYDEKDLDAWIESRLSAPVQKTKPPLDKPLSPLTRQARKYRKRQRASTNPQPELTAEHA
jgi:hypothetical protein